MCSVTVCVRVTTMYCSICNRLTMRNCYQVRLTDMILLSSSSRNSECEYVSIAHGIITGSHRASELSKFLEVAA